MERASPLSVTIEVPGYLSSLVDNHLTVQINGTTVRECLMSLARQYPAMLPELFDVDGKLAVIILKGDQSVDDSLLEMPVKDGDALGLFPIIVGG